MGHVLAADTLGGMLDWAVDDHPDDVFARYESDAFTVVEIDNMARRVGAALDRDGVEPGDRVAALMYPSPWHLALMLACARQGYVWCPLNVALAKRDLEYTLNDLQPVLLAVDADLEDIVIDLANESTAVAELPRVTCAVYDGVVGPNFSDDWLGDDRFEGPCMASASDSFAIIYSGGTTGRPKGIEISQFYCVAAALRLSEMADFGERETFFSVLQFSHAWTPITVMPFCLIENHVFGFWRWWSANKFVDAAIAMEATVVDPYAGMVSTLFLRDDIAAEDFPATRCIAGWGGDEEASKRIRRQFEEQFGVSTLQMYALTETGPLACVEWEGEEQRFGSSGKPRGWYDVIVADDEGMAVPQGEVGEILVRPYFPNTMAKGYINREPHTLETWRDLWVHTGDLGRYDEDGYLFFVGRQGHFLRRRGELVGVGEVESVIAEMPGISEVAVFDVPSKMGEDDIKAVVSLQSGAKLSAQEIVDHCNENLAAFKVPLYVQIVDEMPRSATKQEIERFRLRKLALGEPLQPTNRRRLGYAAKPETP